MSHPLVALLHLCDSLFPLGAFAHSDGLEAATTEGFVRTPDDLSAWLDVTLDETLEQTEGPAVAQAWRAWNAGDGDAIAALDAELHALRPSASGREASRSMGGRLLKTWQQLHPGGGISPATTRPVTLPVAFGIVSAGSDIDLDSAVTGYMYTRLAATVSAAMRLMSIGQHEAHGRLTACLARVPSAVEAVLRDPERSLRSFAPAMDLAAMRQQYGHSRLFRS